MLFKTDQTYFTEKLNISHSV